uniref:Uncharacterized protein n=1 Tax=Cacopsylla melanoneura TaxID=428564 RepID=A0A8D8SSH6_9HEMI
MGISFCLLFFSFILTFLLFLFFSPSIVLFTLYYVLVVFLQVPYEIIYVLYKCLLSVIFLSVITIQYVDTPNSELTMLTPKRYPQGLYSEGGRNIGGLQHNDFYVLMSIFLLTSIVPFDHLLPLCPVIPPWCTALKILRPILHFPDRKHVYHR